MESIPENYKLMFSSLDCSDDDTHFWTYNWENNENLPPCALNFKYPEFEEIVWEDLDPECFKLITVDIKDVLDRFHNGEAGYLLSPFKYYRVRKELSNNSAELKFYYPEVRIGGDHKIHLGEGRHRLNALMKIYGLKEIKAKVFLKDYLI